MTAMHAIDVRSPLDGRLVGRLPAATESDVAAALESAREAQPGWAATPAADRSAAVKAAAAELRLRANDLATVLYTETGRPFRAARDGVHTSASTLEQYAELGPAHCGWSRQGAADFTIPEPRGVVVALTPWNDPVAVACGLLGAALVTGNAVLHKPSERCPHAGMLLDTVLRPHFPTGVLQALLGDGDTGADLASRDVDVVAHVGSTAKGRAIAAASTAKLLLENGGNDPLLVDADVDPEWAAEQAALGAFTNAGQLGTSVERVYVHADVAEPFLDALCTRAKEWNTEPQPQPLVDTGHRDFVHAHVTDAVAAGAQALVGGEIPESRGAYYPATVLSDCTPDMRVMREETFGPVAPVRVVPSFDEGLAEACSGEYSRAATVLTRSMDHAQRAWRALPVGTVKINAVFGGASGTGFGRGLELLDEMITVKAVHLDLP